MHKVIGIVHRNCRYFNIYHYLDRFLDSNQDYYEDYRVETREEVLSYINEHEESYNTYLTENDKIRAYADDRRAYADDDGNVHYVHNPYAECDWYEIGGRWSNSLVGYNQDCGYSMKLKEINYQNNKTITEVYMTGFPFKEEDYLSDEIISLKDIIKIGLEWEEANEEELYLTLVDMHE